MRIVVDDKLIAKRSQAAQRGLLVGGVLLVTALVASFSPRYVLPAYGVVVLGTIVTTWGSRSGTKWLGDLRGDKVLAKVLKGLDNSYRLYNYVLPAEHVLLSPGGLFVLRLQRQDGKISCRGKKWQRPFSIGRVFSFLSEEGLGNPSKQVERDAAELCGLVADHLPDVDAPVYPVIVFVNPKVELDVTAPVVPAVQIRALKRHLRHRAGDTRMPKETYKALTELFDEQAA